MVKPILSHKLISNEKIMMVVGDKIIKTDKGTAKVLNKCVSNTVSNLNIPQQNQLDSTSGKVIDQVV